MFDAERPDGVCDNREHAVIVRMDLAIRGYMRGQHRGSVEFRNERRVCVLCYVTVNEDVARSRGRDDAFGDAGIGAPNPEDLRARKRRMSTRYVSLPRGQQAKERTAHLGTLALD